MIYVYQCMFIIIVYNHDYTTWKIQRQWIGWRRISAHQLPSHGANCWVKLKCRRPRISPIMQVFLWNRWISLPWVYSQKNAQKDQFLGGLFMNYWLNTRIFHPKMTFSPISRPIWLVPWQEVATRTRPLIWIGDLNVAADRVDARRCIRWNRVGVRIA